MSKPNEKRNADGFVLHQVDGREMTVKEIAAMLGISPYTLKNRRISMNGMSYQGIVNMYREGLMLSKHDRWPRHMVHGRWMTLQDVANELDCKVHSIQNWLSKNRDRNGKHPTLEEAYDHFDGAPKRGPGGVAKKHRVNGRMMTIKEAADAHGSTYTAMRQTMARHGCSLEQAVKRLEDRRVDAATKAIMNILNGN